PLPFSGARIVTDLPAGWTETPRNPTGSLQPGQKLDQVFSVTVGPNAEFTQPYWLKAPRQGDRFVWPAGSPANMPFDPPLLATRAQLDYNGAVVTLEVP